MAQFHIVETEGLTRRFGQNVSVNQLNLKVPEGKIYGFLGPNGAGKTTSIKMLLGLIHPDGGSITIFGKSMPEKSLEILRDVGSLVEHPSYYGHLSGYKNLKIVSTLLNVPDRRIGEVLDIVGLTASAKQKVSGYSLGMKQRLGIASALLRHPKLLILDEPTNGLDPAGILEIRQLMLSLTREKGMTILLSSHLLSEVETIADEIGIINRGELVFQGSLQALRMHSKKMFHFVTDRPTEAYLSLVRRGFNVERSGDTISVTLDNETRLTQADMFDALKEHRILNMKETSKSLEDIFLEYTGKDESS